MTRFRATPGAVRKLERSPQMRAGLRVHARTVKAAAETIARGFKQTGHYADSFVIEDTPDGVAVGNTDIAGHLIELGSVNNPPHAPLRRGARAAGLDLKEQ